MNWEMFFSTLLAVALVAFFSLRRIGALLDRYLIAAENRLRITLADYDEYSRGVRWTIEAKRQAAKEWQGGESAHDRKMHHHNQDSAVAYVHELRGQFTREPHVQDYARELQTEVDERLSDKGVEE
jgi:hypothetical protein